MHQHGLELLNGLALQSLGDAWGPGHLRDGLENLEVLIERESSVQSKYYRQH